MLRNIKKISITVLFGCAFAMLMPAISAGLPVHIPSPNYVPRPEGPLKVQGAPVAVGGMNSNGTNQSDLEVLTRSSGLRQFQNLDHGSLRLANTVPLPGVSASFSYEDRFVTTPFRTVTGDANGSVLLVKTDEEFGPATVTEVPVGGDPSSSTMLALLFGQALFPSENGPAPWFAATDRSADTFSLYNPNGDDPGQARFSIEVGTNPVAAAGVNDVFWLVANRGSDDVSFVSFSLSDVHPTGHLEAVETVPVGEAPVAISYLESEGLFAVVNRDSDSVSIVEWTSSGTDLDAEVIQTVGVGSKPASITGVNANGDNFEDLAVANSGSDDVSILLNDGDRRFVPGQTVDVGDRPVSVSTMRLDRYFAGDLAVANAGSRDVSLLLQRDGTGTCYGRPAHTIEGTAESDVLPGTRDPELTRGSGGNDVINGYRGYDCLFGGPGVDTIRGGSSNDRILGGRGNDKLTGFVGNDVIRGGRGDDRICDSDQVFSACFSQRNKTYRPNRSDRDHVFGGRGDDRITAGPQRDMISGGRGDDVIDARDGAKDEIRCGRGDDVARTDIKDETKGCEVVRQREPNNR